MRVRNFGSTPPRHNEEDTTGADNTELKLASVTPETLNPQKEETPASQIQLEEKAAEQERTYPRYWLWFQICDILYSLWFFSLNLTWL